MRELTTTITGVRRLGVSFYGNPRWRVETTDGSWETRVDAMVSFEIDNAPYRRGPVVLTLERPQHRSAERIVNVRLAEPEEVR